MDRFRTRIVFSILAIYGCGVVVLLAAVIPALKAKRDAEAADRNVAFALEGRDIAAFGGGRSWESLPAKVIVLDGSANGDEVAPARKARLHVLWRFMENIPLASQLTQWKEGDGLWVSGQHTLEQPLAIPKLARIIREKRGFLVLMEFEPLKDLLSLPARVKENLVKGHTLTLRETWVAQPDLWENRIVRAVAERGARLVLVRFSAAYSLEQNLELQSRLARRLEAAGFFIGDPHSFRMWPVPGFFGTTTVSLRYGMVLLISVFTPIAIVTALRFFPWKSPLLAFIAAISFAVASGAAIHGLGAFPEAVVGLRPLRGVKLQLILPMLGVLAGLLSVKEIRDWWETPLRMKHVLVGGAGLLVAGGLYLMRSGNFPLISVTDPERAMRDTMENLFVARPRFKEFMIGHPFMILGLYLRCQKKIETDFFLDGRLFMWIGSLGLLSILNTFSHFHVPFEAGLLRTFNGVWLGALVSLPACYWLPRYWENR